MVYVLPAPDCPYAMHAPWKPLTTPAIRGLPTTAYVETVTLRVANTMQAAHAHAVCVVLSVRYTRLCMGIDRRCASHSAFRNEHILELYEWLCTVAILEKIKSWVRLIAGIGGCCSRFKAPGTSNRRSAVPAFNAEPWPLEQ